MWEILGTSEAEAQCRGLPQCRQDGEKLWARKKPGVNGIWAQCRQAVPGCCSALLPEQPGTAAERRPQPAPAFNPVLSVEQLEMPSSWGLRGMGSEQRARCCWEATKPGWEAPSESCRVSRRETLLGAGFVTSDPSHQLETLEAECACPSSCGGPAGMERDARLSGKHLKEKRNSLD